MADESTYTESPLAWVKTGFESRRTLKTWIRCLLVLAGCMTLLVVDKTSQFMGQAGFFAAIVAAMLPPTMALSLFLLASLTLVVGMLLGWGFGCIAMAAALSVRSPALLLAQQKAAQAALSATSTTPVQLQLQELVFHGTFLDPRSSAVYGAFIFIGTFAMGAIKAYAPKLTLLAVFGTIVLNVMCSYGPLFPTAQYTIAKLFVYPAVFYVAIAVTSLVFVFPESLNHVWLHILGTGVLQPIGQILEMQAKILDSKPSNHDTWAKFVQTGVGLRKVIIAGVQGLLGQASLVDLEISVGRLGPTDVQVVSNQLQTLAIRASGLLSFVTFVDESNTQDKQENLDMSKKLETKSGFSPDRLANMRRRNRERESRDGHDLDKLVPMLAESSKGLRDECEAGVKATVDWFRDCNSGRWTGFFSKLDNATVYKRQAALADNLNNLQKAIDQFREVDRVKLIAPYKRFFNTETGTLLPHLRQNPNSPQMFGAKSLYTCFVFCDALVAFAECLHTLLTTISQLDEKRPKPRIWAPSGFGKLGRKIMSRQEVGTVSPAIGESSDAAQYQQSLDDDDDQTLSDEPEHSKRHIYRNPDALAPTTPFGRFGLKLGSVIAFFRSAEGIYSMRHAFISVALWIPSVANPTSAWFTYNNKGLWALIMAQMGLAVYAGDQIAGFVIRILGTLVGLLIGMVTWYISAGHGTGNPYGVVFATTIIAAPLFFARLAGPPSLAMFWTMMTVTEIFVVGYSWIDTHLTAQLVSNSGIGVTLGWKRALLVIIGFTAGFIVMLFPSMTSARVLVRKTLAATSLELGHILAGDVEAFLAEERRAQQGYHGKDESRKDAAEPLKEKQIQKVRAAITAVAARLQGLAPSLTTAAMEPQVKGMWPKEHYQRLLSLQGKIVTSLILLNSSLERLDTKWCSIIVHRTPFLNPNLLSDIFSNIAIVSHALSGGHALPGSLPKLRDRLVYHGRHSNAHGMNIRFGVVPHNRELDSPDAEVDGDEIDSPTVGFEELTLHVLMDDHFPVYSTAVMALSNTIYLLDESAKTVKDLCGQHNFSGFETLQSEYVDREENYLGSRS